MNDLEYIFAPIAGTKEKRSSWASPGSLFALFMSTQGFDRYPATDQRWSRALGGSRLSSGHRVWEFGGDDVIEYFGPEKWTPEQLRKLIFIAHSYGGAVLAYALANSQYLREHIGGYITVGTPIRRDLDSVWAKAREGSDAYHVCIYGVNWGARIRFLAQRFRMMREMPWADLNYGVKGGHSGMVRQPKHTPQIIVGLDALKAAMRERGTSDAD